MNAEPKKTESVYKERIKAFLAKIPGSLIAFCTKNWAWRLLALFLAVCLWAGLISQDTTLTRERIFSDVTINVNGAETLRRNSGLVVLSGLEPENLNVRLRVDVPQREYANVTASNYNPRVELTRITGPGEQTVRIAATSTTTYGVVQDISPATLDLVVDEYVTNYRVPVSVNVKGKHPKGFWGDAISLDPSLVAVSGPRSIVDQVAGICVDFDASRLTARAGKVRMALPMRFLDANGKEVSSDMLEVSSAGVVLRTIIAEQTLYPTRVIPMDASALVKGEPAEGYRVAGASLSVSSLTAAGSEEALSSVEKLFLDSAVDVSGADQSFAVNVRVRKPADLKHLSSDVVVLSVDIEPIVITRTFDNVKISVEGTAGGLRAASDARTVSVTVTGPQPVLNGLRTANITAFVNASGLEAGVSELPVEFRVDGADTAELSFASTPSTVNVTLTQK